MFDEREAVEPPVVNAETGETDRTITTPEQAAQMLDSIAADTQSEAVKAIAGLVSGIELPGRPGLVALQEASNQLADLDVSGLLSPNQTTDQLRDQLDVVMTYLMRRRSDKQIELNLMASAERVVNNQTPPLGTNPEDRAQAAREALRSVIDTDPMVTEDASTPAGDLLAPKPDPLTKIERNFAPTASETQQTFDVGFDREAQDAMRRHVLALAQTRLSRLPADRLADDTVYAVLGDEPRLAQELLGFTGGEVADTHEILAMPFTTLAAKAGLELPPELIKQINIH